VSIAHITAEPLSVPRARVADFVALTKPRIAVLVLFTVAVGAALAAGGWPGSWLLAHTLLGTALVAGGASALNQLLERQTDALMQRTEDRPLPSGRLQPIEVLVFGLVLVTGGLIYLAWLLPQSLAAKVAAICCACYVGLYTPLKRTTTLNTIVGAIPGALPPVIGWTAVRGTLEADAITLFAIVFVWQVPHFLAIAWMYRDDYARAGLKMLSVVDPDGGLSGRQMVGYCLALVPVSLTPALLGLAGPVYVCGALMLGLMFTKQAYYFACRRSVAQARQVLRASLIYLPGLLALLLLDGVWTNFALAMWK
jgi:protoheme IX farnesyltransferase